METSTPGTPGTPGGLGHGAAYVWRGFSMWRRRPGLMLLGMVPALIVLVVVLAALVAVLLVVDDVAVWATGFADGWNDGPRRLVRVLLGIVLVLASVFVASATFTGLTLTVGDPFYARIWRETEVMLGGPMPESELGFWRSARDGLVLAVLGLVAGLVVAVLAFVPLVGAVIGVVLGLLVSGWLLGNELLTRPLEPRGLDRAARRTLLGAHRSQVLGFGMATQVFFLVPLGAVVVMPAAVVGATMLARDLTVDLVAKP